MRDAARHTLLLKLEPQFGAAAHKVELPEIDSLPARWDAFLHNQDMIGYDRDRLAFIVGARARPGRDTVASAVRFELGGPRHLTLKHGGVPKKRPSRPDSPGLRHSAM